MNRSLLSLITVQFVLALYLEIIETNEKGKLLRSLIDFPPMSVYK